MSSKEIFREAFQRYGNPVSAPDLDPKSYEIAYDTRSFAQDIYCDYIETDEINAMACIYHGHELVAIFYGLINLITTYYAAILSDPLMFPQIGDPSQENVEFNRVRIEYLKKYPTLGVAPLPVCPIRSRATLRLISCAQLFLHAHEVGHIVLGHLDLVRDEFGASAYEELPIVPLSEEEKALRKALELQADQGAALTSLYLFRTNLENAPPVTEKFKEADLLWSIAVETLFVLFEQVTIKRGQRNSMTHPSPFARWMNVKMTVVEHAEEHGIRNLKLAEPKPSVINQLRNWLEGNGLSEKHKLFATDEINLATNELFSTWETLKPYQSKLKDYQAKRGNRVTDRV